MTVDRIMTRDVTTVGRDDLLFEIRAQMRKGDFRHVVVVDEAGKLEGVISDRDILEAASPFFETPHEERRDAETLHKKAHEVKSKSIVTASLDTTIEAAAALMVEHGVSCLPVLEENDELAGIVTSMDILKYTAGAPWGAA